MRSFLFALSLLVLTVSSSVARDRGHAPKALFVMINTEANRTKYFAARNKTKELEQLTDGIKHVKKCMMLDFADNFYILPVYYFDDTNLAKIIARNYDGVLYDNNKLPVKPAKLGGIDSDFCIVYYGMTPSSEKVVKNGKVSEVPIVEHYGSGLVVLNSKDEPMPHFRYFITVPANPPTGKYTFMSNDRDLEYIPAAGKLQERFAKRYHLYD